MRPRKWILILFIVLFVTCFLLYQGVKLLERNRDIEKILVQRVSSLAGGAFSVEKVRLGFLAVYLQDVNISVPLQAFKLHVNDIKIGFSLRKLIDSKGDFGRSIDKIILVDPRFEIHARKDTRTDSFPIAGDTIFKRDQLRKLPVSHVLIKDGSFEFIGRGGKTIPLGGALDGRLSQGIDGVTIDLKGRMASLRRNLSVSAFIAPAGKRHHLSVRLKNARLPKAIRLDGISLTSGTIDGVCEFSFPDSAIFYNLQSSGHLHISDGELEIKGVSYPVTDGQIELTLENNRIVLDTLNGSWHGVQINGTGVWNLFDETKSHGNVRLSNIRPSTLPVTLPPDVSGEITGRGWLSAQIDRTEASGFLIQTSCGGFTIKEYSLLNLQGTWLLQNDSLELLSLKASHEKYSLEGRGDVHFRNGIPFYSFSGNFQADSSLLAPHLVGAIEFDGSISGEGKNFHYNLSACGRNLVWQSLRMDSLRVLAGGDRHKMFFSSEKNDDAPVSFSGIIHSPLSDSAHIEGSYSISEAVASSLVSNLSPDGAIIQPVIEGEISGPLHSPDVQGRLQFGGIFSADLRFTAVSSGKRTDAYTLNVSNSTFSYNEKPLPISAVMNISPDSLTIDSIRIANYLRGRAFIKFDMLEEISVLLSGKAIPLSLVDALFLDGKNVLREGVVDVNMRFGGQIDSIRSRSRIRFKNANFGGVQSLETDMVIAGEGRRWTVHPFVLRKDKRILVSVDSLAVDSTFFIAGQLTGLDLSDLGSKENAEDTIPVRGVVSASFSSSDSGFPITMYASAPTLSIKNYVLNKVVSQIELTKDGIHFPTLTASDSAHLEIRGSGSIPWSYLSGEEKEHEAIHAQVSGEGDLLAAIEQYVDSPIGGQGKGSFDIVASVSGGQWNFSEARVDLAEGVLTLHPLIHDDITSFSFHSTMLDSSRLQIKMGGKVRNRRVQVYSSHQIPEGVEPIQLGPVNCGVLLTETPDRGIHIHLPGFMSREEVADIEFAGREPFAHFAVSGPIDRLRLTGTWVIRDVEFTFPLLSEEHLAWDFDPFPYITWDMDIKIGNRNVLYFYDVGMKKRLMRFLEAYVDPNGEVNIRGRDLDKTFRLYGELRSYRGAVYYGKTFNRNVEVGVDFVPEPFPGENGFENLPVVWGSAEAFSDTSRFDRVKLTLMTKNPETGTLSEKGRFNEITFRLSSEFDEIPGEAEREFYRQAGVKAVTFEGAGGFVSGFGEQYLHRYFLQRIERRLARRLGLDVISFETSIASNYFYYLYNNSFQGLAGQWDNLALANVGVTVGRYFGRDKFFLKWRTELIPSDTLIYPEHRLGLEYYPLRYLVFDVSYGFHRGEQTIEHNPRLNMQLRLPIGGVRNAFDF